MVASRVKTLSIISIVLGALGLLGAFSGAAAFLAGPQKTMGAMKGMSAEEVEVQQEMAKAIVALTEDWKTFNGIVTILSFIVAAALIAGGIMSLKIRKQGRDVLATTFVVAIPLKVVQAVASVWIGMATIEILHEYLPKIMQAANPPGRSLPAGAQGVATSIGEAAALLGIAFGVGWILLQLGFFIVGAIYLRKPEVRATFGS